MRSSRSIGLFAGALLLVLVSFAPLHAAGPPSALLDARRVWVGHSSTFKFVAPVRWVEHTTSGQIVYRENNRHQDYIELYDHAGKRYLRLYPTGVYIYLPDLEVFRRIGEGNWDELSRKPLDLTRNASDRRYLTSEDQRRSFPRLGHNFEVLGPSTVTYNCICWSLGNNDSWVWPRAAGQRVTLADFDALYLHYGYRRIVGLDLSRQEGADKVVLFAARRDNGSIEITHATRQMSDGSWSSKLGSLPLIRHLRPEDVAGPTYGQPYVVYVRRKGAVR